MIRPEILQKLNPAPDALLNALSEEVDDGMLMEIAAADYGMETEEHLAQLYRIRDSHEIPAPMGWNPREVLNLTRWHEPDKTYPEVGEQNRRGHLIRAFACTVLLVANTDPSNVGYFDGENQTLAQLLASLPVIGSPFQVNVLRFIAWRAQDFSDIHEDGLFYLLALLILILRTKAPVTTPELQEIIDYLYVFEKQIRQEQSTYSTPPETWLLGLTYFAHCHDFWIQIGKEIGAFAPQYKNSSVESALLDIANRLAD
jgi:hypothetical protein